MSSAYLTTPALLPILLEEAGDGFLQHHELVLTKGDAKPLWHVQEWVDVEVVEYESIGDAAKKLRERAVYWVAYSPTLNRRTQLVLEKLRTPKVKPLEFGGEFRPFKFSCFTLIDEKQMWVASSCSPSLPLGEVVFAENKTEPPSRAYLKLWEVFTLYGAKPAPGESCVEVGAAPGGWTWVLLELGLQVDSYDRAPLAPVIAKHANLQHRTGNAFSVKPYEVDWFFSDIICEPSEALKLAQSWLPFVRKGAVCTLKFKGDTDFSVIEEFRRLPGKLVHLYNNKHELTWIYQSH